MREVTVTEARRSWSKLVALADKGEEITITRRGKTVARLVSSTKSRFDGASRTMISPVEPVSGPG